jgi:AAA family ATP:ADP antiporter
MSSVTQNRLVRLIIGAADIEANEIKATVTAFAFVFLLMASYFILRPVRDAMASDWTDAEVSFLWTLQFFISIAVISLYGFAVSRVRFRHLVPGIYSLFAASFVLFYFGTFVFEDRVLIDKSYYVWVSTFALFNTSVFWSYMADLFNKQQAKRLFAIIASGASAGALVGPAIPTIFAGMVGGDALTLLAAIMLMLPVPLIPYLARLKITDLRNENVHADLDEIKIGGNPLAGFRLFLTNPYLLAIGVFLLLYTVNGSFLYFQQKNLLEVYDRETRTQILGSITLLINLLTFGLAYFATGRLVKKLGMGITLALMPVLMVAGMLILAFTPVITILLALNVVRNAGNYAVTQPARQMLFTEVDKETRFKAKPVIDVVVYRGGDMMTAWFFTSLTEGLGLGMTAVSIVGSAIAALWAGVGIYMGRVYDKRTPQTKTQLETQAEA